MRVFSKENFTELLGEESLDSFITDLSTRLQTVGHTELIPQDSGRKTALARLFGSFLLKNTSVCIFVSGWSTFESSENLDLFYGYRRSLGENRLLIEAPVHLFEQTETASFASILCMVLYFFWDAWVFDLARHVLIKISHDEWLEIQVADNQTAEEFRAALERCGLPLITTQEANE